MKQPQRKTISRTRKQERYFAVENALFNDEHLSWEARGLMGYLLSKPDHWQVRLHDLMKRGPAGEHKLRRMILELRNAGYLHTRRSTRPDGTFDWVTTIHESPLGVVDGGPPEPEPDAVIAAVAGVHPRATQHLPRARRAPPQCTMGTSPKRDGHLSKARWALPQSAFR